MLSVWRASARSGTARQHQPGTERSAKMTIDDIFAERYGITPEGYYRQELREGVAAAAALLDLNQKVNDIWECEKNGGFYPVNETDLPEGFI